MRFRHERASKNGFTLPEILMALIVFALASGFLAQIMQTGLRQSAIARSHAAAVLFAQSELARVGVELPLVVGRAGGNIEDGMQWQTKIDLVEGPSDHQSLALYRVQVTVTWAASPAEQLTLTTLRTGVPSE